MVLIFILITDYTTVIIICKYILTKKVAFHLLSKAREVTIDDIIRLVIDTTNVRM